jgi:hypothetical protein
LGNLIPHINHSGQIPTHTLGTSTRKWKEVWSTATSLNSGSDRNIKKDIEKMPIQYEKFFDSIIPVRYRFIENESNRFHTGFIS